MNKIDSTNIFSKVEELALIIAWIVSEEKLFITDVFFDLSSGKTTY